MGANVSRTKLITSFAQTFFSTPCDGDYPENSTQVICNILKFVMLSHPMVIGSVTHYSSISLSDGYFDVTPVIMRHRECRYLLAGPWTYGRYFLILPM